MATHTTHYNLIKPESADRVAIGNINDNSDTIDGYLYKANERADQMADDYNTSETYNTGDYVRRENYLYKCNTDNTTGTWDDTKWDRVKVMDEITQGGGGGSSTLAGLNDVSLATPTDGQLLGYNGTSHKWENVNGGGGGSSTFAGLNDVNVQGVSNGDIARYNSTTGKWTDSSDLTDLELSVSQLSSSVLSIAGDVDALELTVSQMSASTLPYDANTSTKQKIDSVESSIPTSASDLPYSSSKSTKQAIDEISAKGLAYRSLLTITAITTTSTTYNTYGGRKFSDYDILIFILTSDGYGNDYRETKVLPAGMFAQTGKKITTQVLHGAASGNAGDYGVSSMTVEYNSDTSIKATAGGRAIVNLLQIIGIKFE